MEGEGARRLRPDDEPRSALRGLPREAHEVHDDAPFGPRIPFRVLRHVPLDRGDPQPFPLGSGPAAAQDDGPSRCGQGDEHQQREPGGPRAPRHRREEERRAGVGRQHQKRHGVDPPERRRLQEGKVPVLRVPEEAPGEAGEEPAAQDLQADPGDRRDDEREGADSAPGGGRHPGEEGDVGREIQDQEGEDQAGDDPGEVAVDHHDPRDPVEQDGEEGRAAEVPAEKRGARRGAGDRPEERHQRHEREEAEIGSRVGQGEKDAGHDRQRRAAPGRPLSAAHEAGVGVAPSRRWRRRRPRAAPRGAASPSPPARDAP